MTVFRKLTASAASLTIPLTLMISGAPAMATDWHAVITGKNETIEIDRDRIASASGGTLGWSRIKLGRSVNDPGGRYNAIHAQNLYDCDARRFTTLRRAYYDGDTLVRDEAVSRQRINTVQPGSIDERLLNDACRTSGSDALAAAESTVNRAAVDDANRQRIAPMHADIRTLADKSRAHVVPVADAHGETSHAAEKPKRIEMPAIDKAAADAAAAGAAAKPSAPTAPAAPAVAAPAHGAPAAAHAPVAAAHSPPAKAPAAETRENPVEKRVRELQYATSGPPRKAAKKKAVENPAHKMHTHWSYEGEAGPANWNKLEPGFATCATGKRQSPIDIRSGIKVDTNPIRFDYRPTLFNVVDNGHTIQVNIDDGQSITVLGKRYDLLQFHFHKPSEERVSGRSFDMVVHLVHKNEDGHLAVIAVLLEQGTEHPVIQTIWNNLPLEKGSETSSEVQINLANLLPENRAYWTYMGSLTTPPCSENVLWMVLKQPAQVSPEQVATFSRLYRNNARPVQPANGRLVKETR